MTALILQIVGLCLDLFGVLMMANGFFVFKWRDVPTVLFKALVDRRASTGVGLVKRLDNPGLAFRGVALVAVGFGLQLIGLFITLTQAA